MFLEKGFIRVEIRKVVVQKMETGLCHAKKGNRSPGLGSRKR